MKRRNTVDRWIADIFQTPELTHKANRTDRYIDQKIGMQIKNATKKTPETDWRRLVKNNKEE